MTLKGWEEFDADAYTRKVLEARSTSTSMVTRAEAEGLKATFGAVGSVSKSLVAAGHGRRQKYHAQPQEIDGYLFASTAEATRYLELRTLERVVPPAIDQLRLQVSFPLTVEGELLGHYRCDFTYRDLAQADTPLVVEDVKGMRTPLYRWKKRHFEAQYHMRIQEIG